MKEFFTPANSRNLCGIMTQATCRSLPKFI